MRDLGFNEKGMLTEAAMDQELYDVEEPVRLDKSPNTAETGIEMTDIKGKENLKNRGDTSLDFLEKEIEI